ncbi:MAG: addiction module protein, partial [Candidatus Omnitrophica bacterium]|nr:addiction module protein [Candidatus Omnitrophota bacterium]
DLEEEDLVQALEFAAETMDDRTLDFSLSKNPETIPLTDTQREELNRRKAEHKRDSSAAKPWSEIKARLQSRHY